jgi:UDP-xylose/UDP-N-acetylglucosamine transporter B4
MNNQAFAYNISVPVHIILRSGGSMTTLLVGWCWGKRYSRVQVISVVILTVGCVLSALADGEGMVSFFLAAKLFGSYSAF